MIHLRWLVAAAHLLALAIGFGAVTTRASALRGPLDEPGLRRALAADSLWGLAGMLWIVTGVWRVFGGFEKGTGYYMLSGAFQAKMAMLALLLGMEIYAAVTLVRWRAALARGAAPDLSRAPALARVSQLQAVLVVGMVLAATAMARGLWM